jgi:hypothetical protein
LKTLLFKPKIFWHIAAGKNNFEEQGMGAWPQRHIDGFEVECQVIRLDTGMLAIEVAVCRRVEGEFERRWSLPRFVTFEDPGTARRHAELVLSGIVSVDEATGEPRYGIL